MENNPNLLVENDWNSIKNIGGKFQLKKKQKTVLDENESIDKFVSSIIGIDEESSEQKIVINQEKKELQNNGETYIASNNLAPTSQNLNNQTKSVMDISINTASHHQVESIKPIITPVDVRFSKIKNSIELVFDDYKEIKNNMYYILLTIFNIAFPIGFTYYLINTFEFIAKQANLSSPMGYFVIANILLIGFFASFLIHIVLRFLIEPKITNQRKLNE